MDSVKCFRTSNWFKINYFSNTNRIAKSKMGQAKIISKLLFLQYYDERNIIFEISNNSFLNLTVNEALQIVAISLQMVTVNHRVRKTERKKDKSLTVEGITPNEMYRKQCYHITF